MWTENTGRISTSAASPHWSRKVNGVISVDLQFNRFLCLFPCNPFLKLFELILGSDTVRNIEA